MDREADLVSPLLSPLTYEGLVDELFGIDQAQIKMTAAELGDSGPGGSLTQDSSEAVKTTPVEEDGEALLTVPLSDVDGIFTQIRDLSIEKLGAFLQEKAITIKERYTSFRSNKDASIPEIHDFVKKIPQLTKDYRSLNRHINIASIIKEVTDGKEFRDQWQGERGMLEGETFLDDIERIICVDAEAKEFYRVLRLMCIQSLTSGGIRASRYDTLRRSIIQTYGYEHLFTLSNCERAGLLKKKDIILVDTTQSVWQGVRKQLKLIDDDVDVIEPTSISYVSSGYAPLSVRLVEKLGGRGQQSWRGIGDVMRLLPGPTLEFTQTSVPEELSDAIDRTNHQLLINPMTAQNNASLEALALTSTKKIMLVLVIGGLSFMEIAAFRFLSNHQDFPYRIVMASTKYSNGSKLLDSLSQL
jgi:vacuolar protein sorting-associated protein 33A